MRRVALALWNPIVAKEYRSRMRTWRSPIAMTVYILLLGGLGWAIFSAMSASARGAFNGSQAANYGQSLFLWLIIFQMVLLAFITPALTAGAISSEREHQTIDLLFVTKLPPFSILWGKLLASMSFVLLLLLLSVPIFSLVFLFGGIELDQVLAAFVTTAVAALTLGILGLAFSTVLPKTLPATVASYGAAFVLMAGTLLFGLLFPTTIDTSTGQSTLVAPPAITYLSPIVPLVTIAWGGPIPGYGVRGVSSGGGVGCSQTSPGGPAICQALSANGRPVGKAFVGYPGNNSGASQGSGTTIPDGLFSGWQYWQASVVLWLLISLLAIAISAVLLPPTRRLPWRRRAPAAQLVANG